MIEATGNLKFTGFIPRTGDATERVLTYNNKIASRNRLPGCESI